ncbi:MAG: flap endonuclease-1 [Methanomethylovorans sp.]|uniref:flap endonuclease-1 n=1 Tax=Methanomethylovorans sp. TaxID=2758717 RepID=UPI000B128F35|nr:flap endonuclease-1 [Methanomethylovorans sp.]
MGTDIGELLKKRQVEISELSHKVVAIDAYNMLYQFLSTIRQRDGTPLKDSRGNITSHLSGILYRMTSLMEEGIKPVFVFDGKPSHLKARTIEKRMADRESATIKWEEAKEKGLAEEAYMYAQASSKVTQEIVDDSRRLLLAMGVPWVNAPSEGEAQAAHLVKRGDANYVASQDYDSLLFGAPLVVRNLTITGKRKLPKKNIFVEVRPEIMQLEENLAELGINQSQLVDIAICIGTDYNQGLERIGPKKALKLIKEHSNIENVLLALEREIEEVQEIKNIFLNPSVTDNYTLKWKRPNTDEIIAFLCEEHDFSKERVIKACERLEAISGPEQRTLDQWF